ncbi:transcription factor IIIA-like [Ornithodoros turicata]|uniref:transcription factor IIIA-like n=1 Tax=Ornithodoros turicata TaxID=34597 RepID=UPI003139C985
MAAPCAASYAHRCAADAFTAFSVSYIMESRTKSSPKSTESVFVCCHEGCSATFAKSNKLEWHMRLHTGERPFICPILSCRMSYTRKFHLTRHMKVHQATDENEQIQTTLKCTKEGCNKEFSTKHGLYKHLKYSHEKRTFRCEVCLRTFIKHQHLKVHSYEHTGTLPFRCPQPGCDKAFLLPSRLKQHFFLLLGYKCDMDGCTQVFPKWSMLRKHRKVDHQRSYKCDTCERVFYSRSNLDAHVATHASDRECFACPTEGCSRTYLQQSSLRAHVRAAHENRRFACSTCGRMFFTKQALSRHQKLHDSSRPLPKKKRPSNKCRRKGFHTKSAAAVLSGYDEQASDEARKLPPVAPAVPLATVISTCYADPQDASKVITQTMATMGS